MDAYRRGVAAILQEIGANAIMCCGHAEYALPVGRKSDPSFDMEGFRLHVAMIMAGTAPMPTVIPAVDSNNRPTLRRGDAGDPVPVVQAALGLPATGIFDAAMEAAVRRFQERKGLVPDGIVGPRTWAAIS